MCHQSSHHCPCSSAGHHTRGVTGQAQHYRPGQLTPPLSLLYIVCDMWRVSADHTLGWRPLAAIITPRHHATIFSQFDIIIQITPCAPSLAGMEIWFGRSAGWTLCSPRYSDCAPGQDHCCDHSQSWLPRPVIWHHQDLILHQAGAGQF